MGERTRRERAHYRRALTAPAPCRRALGTPALNRRVQAPALYHLAL